MDGLHVAGMSYRDVSSRTGHAAWTVIRALNQWIKENHTQIRPDTVMSTAWDDYYHIPMIVTDCKDWSRVLSRY